MPLTPFDVASLSRSLSFWEYAEYISGGLVALGCVGEYVAEFTDWFTGGVKERKAHLTKGSTLLLITALALELICLVKTNSLSGSVIGSLDIVAEEAAGKAGKALDDAGQATVKADAAEGASAEAVDKSGQAKLSASNALVLASGARKEADSFEVDIVSAKTQAADAESHLAAALERTARLEAQLSWRTVTPEQSATIAAYLKPSFFNPNMNFRGLKISLEYNQGDLEASEYAEDLGRALRVALNGFGVEIGEPKGIIVMRSTGPPITGLILQVNRANDGRAVVLQRALGAAGIVAVGEPKSKPEGTFSLFVGVRPRPSAAKQ